LAELEAAAGRCAASVALLKPLRDPEHPVHVPDDVLAPALYRLGVCAFEGRDYAAAADALAALLDQRPDHELAASASYFCGEAQLHLGRFKAAVENFTRLVEKYPKDPARPAALLRLGDCHAALQQWEAAEREFSRFLREYKDDERGYQAQFGVGWARENLTRYDEAIAAYRGVVERHQGPTAARAQFQIGECLVAQTKLDEAITELLKVDILYAYPEWSAAALFEAGRVFEQLGQVGPARRQYETVRDKHADSKWAGPATQRLERLAAAPRPAVAAPTGAAFPMRGASVAKEK
jgi:TolA-binding protein